MKVKILITGSQGFIGKHLIGYLRQVEPNVQILGLDRNSQKDKSTPAGIDTAACDLADAKAVSKIVTSFAPDKVFHLAGNSRVSPSIGMPEYFEHNFLTTMNLKDALDKLPHPVSLFFSSSVHVYGNQEAEVTESSITKPVGAYGFTKFLAEEGLRHWVSESPKGLRKVVVARLYSCIGPGQGEGFVVSDLCRKIAALPAKGTPTLTVGPLSATRWFLDVRDAVGIFARLLETGKEAFEVFNIGSPHQLQISHVLQMLLKIAEKSPRIDSVDSTAPNAFAGLRVSFKKVEKTLVPLTFRPIEQTLRDIYDTYCPKKAAS